MLKLVKESKSSLLPPGPEQLEHHESLFNGYFRSYRLKNYALKTIEKEQRFLKGWFKEHELLTWEAMKPVIGRKRIRDYGNTMLDSGLQVETVRSYLGILRRYFSYCLEFPHIKTAEGMRRVSHVYGAIDQPVTEWDLPAHVYDGERLGLPFDPEKLYEFYEALRSKYLVGKRWEAVRGRNYAMVVLAGESGLRVDELLNLEIKKDLFFESKKLQTRSAKGMKGSGKRARVTLFTPLARDTVRYYLEKHRPKLVTADSKDYLFLSQAGRRLTYSNVNGALKSIVKVVKKSGFPVSGHLGWHWFRRIFSTRFIERFPGKLSILITLLGHVNPNTVHKYIRHSEAWMDNEVQKVLEGDFKWPSAGD